MEFQLIITGSLAEIQQVTSMLNNVPGEVLRVVTKAYDPDNTIIPKVKQPKQRKTKQTIGKREKAPEDLQVHCHTCGHLFHPKFMHTKHCSKKCYMQEYFEVRKKKVEQSVDPAEPVTETGPTSNVVAEKSAPPSKVHKGSDFKSKFKKDRKPTVNDNYGGLY
jgi:hypothetical protein